MIIELSNDKIWKLEKMNRKNILQVQLQSCTLKERDKIHKFGID